jgi:hypothetical protein
MMDDFLESEEFYNAMQAYRHAPIDGQERVIECFEKVKSMVRAENAALKAELIEEKAAHFKTHNWLIDRNEELVAAQKDAERYRWLRDECIPEKNPNHTWIVEAHGEEWDAAIDDAMKENKNAK